MVRQGTAVTVPKFSDFRRFFVYFHQFIQRYRSVFLSEGAKDEWQAPTGNGSGGQGLSPVKCLQVRL